MESLFCETFPKPSLHIHGLAFLVGWGMRNLFPFTLQGQGEAQSKYQMIMMSPFQLSKFHDFCDNLSSRTPDAEVDFTANFIWETKR